MLCPLGSGSPRGLFVFGYELRTSAPLSMTLVVGYELYAAQVLILDLNPTRNP